MADGTLNEASDQSEERLVGCNALAYHSLSQWNTWSNLNML